MCTFVYVLNGASVLASSRFKSVQREYCKQTIFRRTDYMTIYFYPTRIIRCLNETEEFVKKIDCIENFSTRIVRTSYVFNTRHNRRLARRLHFSIPSRTSRLCDQLVTIFSFVSVLLTSWNPVERSNSLVWNISIPTHHGISRHRVIKS